MSDNIILDKAKELAVGALKLSHEISSTYGDNVITVGLVKCSTAVGEYIHRAKYDHEHSEQVKKLQEALKECHCAEYWLEILEKSGFVSRSRYEEIASLCASLRRMLTAAIKARQGK